MKRACLIFAFGSFAYENIIYPKLEPSLEQYVVDAWLNNSPGSQKIFFRVAILGQSPRE